MRSTVVEARGWEKRDAIRNLHNSLHPVKVELNELDWKSGLSDYGFCKKQENGWAITNLGAALFARDLREFPSLEFRYVVVRQYKGANNLDISAETFFYEGYAISLDKIVKYVMSLLERCSWILPSGYP